ncbi:flagellar assembly protein FliW [Paludibacterium denitrificans]|uniref:Flagellar assembly factor FliW n=1 Tax=Paludibacterium denitrificans TaxID=2675226 RepID=A0A844GEX0_9NEIS|nr:flagellar assembly protein FliW [Paludibacterium denitrificans]MTD33768.1 flagellar biosynthesis protein FliW [Paludibacterium denitrificans]
MRFDSSLLGNVDIDESTIITFPQGIPALENCTRFKLFHNESQTEPDLYWLQSPDDADVTFSLTNPLKLGVRYEIDLNDDETALLELQTPEPAVILVMLYKEPSEDGQVLLGSLRANIRNPLVINTVTRKGLQKTGLNCDILLHNQN